MHLPFDQGKSPADAAVGSREVPEVIQIIDFAGGGHLLTSRASGTDTGNSEMMPLAIVIQSAFSGFCRAVVGGGEFLNPDRRRRRGTRRLGCRGASAKEECCCETRESRVDG